MKRQAIRWSETSSSVDVEADKPKRRTRLGKRRRTVTKADRPWVLAPIPLKEEDYYCFWTSQTAVAAYIFVSLSLIRGDIRLLHGATLVILAQIGIVLRRWARFLSDLGILQECIDVSRGYIKLIRRHTMAFVDQDKGHPLRKFTGAMVLYQRNVQFQVLSWYLQKRNRIMKRKAIQELEQSRRHLIAG